MGAFLTRGLVKKVDFRYGKGHPSAGVHRIAA